MKDTKIFLFFVALITCFTWIFYETIRYVDERDLTVSRENVSLENKIKHTIPDFFEVQSNDEDETELRILFKTVLQEDAEMFSIYLYRPELDEDPIIYNHASPMRPASMIKVFVLAKVMDDAHNQKLSLDEKVMIDDQNVVGGAGVVNNYDPKIPVSIRELAEVMITESDNTATNILIDKVGGLDAMNQYCVEHGYFDTKFNHKMMMQNRYSGSNSTSVIDLGTLFTRLYKYECVSLELDSLMIDFLTRLKDRECFPSALPDWKIAHKTGEIDELYDDGGIFYNDERGNFILVIMNDRYSSRSATIQRMRRIAKIIATNYMTRLK